MAGSFHVFRKNQKLFMAIAAILAIFVFVFADMVTSSLQNAASRGQSSPTTTLVKWDGGSISTAELNSLSRRRFFISDFLRALLTQGAQTVMSEGGTPTEPNVPSFILEQENLNPRSVMVGAVTTRVVADVASEAGMTVSDEMINNYLREFGLGKVTDAEIGQILERTSRSTASHGEKQLFAGLRELLLQYNYMRTYTPVIQNVMPEQRWDDWQQINRRIALEAAIFPTEQFLGEVSEPTDADIQELYEQFKEQLAYSPQRVAGGVQLNSPDPGFRVPRKVRMQFLRGDVNEWTEKMLDQVTDEEIADYYERNKRTQFVEVDLFSTDSSDEESDDSSEEETSEAETPEESSEEKSETDEPETTETEEEAAPEEKPEESAEESPEESEAKPEVEETTTEEPTEETEASETEPAEPAAEEAEPAPAEEESSSSIRKSPFRLASFQEESGEEEEESPIEEEPAESDSEPETTEEAETSEEPAEESAEESSAPEDKPEASADDKEEEKPVEYIPLEEVSDEIRRQLANDKAVVELEKVMQRAYAELQSEYNRYGGDVVRAKTEERDPPAPPEKLASFDSMATELGLKGEITVPRSYPELSETALGKARDTQTNRIPVTYAAFAEDQLELYEPFLAQDLDGHWFLTLKLEDIESTVPALDDVREEVVEAWKKLEAAKLALERSKKLGAEAEKAGQTLADFFADKNFNVVTTDLFSKLTFGTTPAQMRQGARLGEVPPLGSIDLEFMDEAFDLEDGQVIGLLNHDHSAAYAIRLNRREKTEEELRQQFLLEANDWFGGRIMASARFQFANRDLMTQLTERVGLNVTELEKFLQPDDEQ